MSDPGRDDPPLRSIPIPLHHLLGLEFTAPEEGSLAAEVRMPVRSEACGPTGSLHGGAIATMVDLACALAAVRASTFDPMTESLITADMHVRYLGRPRTDTVTARAEIVRIGSQLIVVECRVVDGDGHVFAVADLSMMKVRLRRPLLPDAERTAGAPEL